MSVKEDENQRQYRVIDQMLTAHSHLRDVYRRLGTMLSVALLSVSIILNAFVFTSDDVLASLGVQATWAKNGLALASVMALVLSIVELRVDWSGRSSLHDEAVERLAALKLSYRAAFEKMKTGDFADAARLRDEYTQTMTALTPIPEKSFTVLCARHRYKRLLNQRSCDNPACPVWILRVKLRLEGIGQEFNAPRRRQSGNFDSRSGS